MYYLLYKYSDCLSYEEVEDDDSLAFLDDKQVKYCEDLISHCEYCSDKDTCTECSTGYYSILSDKLTCVDDISKFDLDKYYLSAENTYSDCTNSKYNDIPNCKKCSNKESCDRCQDGYTFINFDQTRCVQIESLKNEYILDPSYEVNYIPCQNIYDNCNTCDDTKCLSCKEGFAFINNDFSKCSPEDNGDVSEISKDEAEKLASISLSYERISNFNYDKDNSKISFDLSTLTTVGEVNKGDEIKVYVNLIYNNGMSDIESTESVCVAQDIEEQSGSARAKFVCTIENLEGDDYYSLRYNSSDSICGVPKDEISLDPVLTNKYKNNVETKILPTFTYESIDHTSCSSEGILTISGTITEKLNDVKKVNIPLTYPEGITLTCEFNDNQDKIECKVDREINNKTIIIEQTVIKQGDNMFKFYFKRFIRKDKCQNYIQAS